MNEENNELIELAKDTITKRIGIIMKKFEKSNPVYAELLKKEDELLCSNPNIFSLASAYEPTPLTLEESKTLIELINIKESMRFERNMHLYIQGLLDGLKGNSIIENHK